MKDFVRLVDTRELPWEPLGPPGLFTKRLSRDPRTGERTALQRAVPELGQRPPGQAHFHGTYEEILVVRGSMSFDSVQWLQPHGYVYHPPHTVHGFQSALRGETWFLSRVGRDLDFTFVPEPPRRSPYYVGGAEPSRGWTYVPDPQAETWPVGRTEAAPIGGVPVRELSVDAASGEGAWLVRLPAGWHGAAGRCVDREYLEIFLLDGRLQMADGACLGPHGYTFRPFGAGDGPVSTDVGALAYVNLGARLRRA